MNNAHLRFGWLTYSKRTEKRSTHFRVPLDRFMGERLSNDPRSLQAHLISVLGGDTQIAALSAAVCLKEDFTVEGPELKPTRVFLGEEAQCYRGSIQVPSREKPIRHLVAVSRELATTGTGANTERTLLLDSIPRFVWTSLAHIHGLPGTGEWAQWFFDELKRHKAIHPLVGIGCGPVLVRGEKDEFLQWLGRGVRFGELRFPESNGPLAWNQISLAGVLQLKQR